MKTLRMPYARESDVLDGRVLLRSGGAAGAAMNFVRYTRHGRGFPQ